jgi:hypothetical protein
VSGRGCACVCLILFDRETTILRWARHDFDCSATERITKHFSFLCFLTPNVGGYFPRYIWGAVVVGSFPVTFAEL